VRGSVVIPAHHQDLIGIQNRPGQSCNVPAGVSFAFQFNKRLAPCPCKKVFLPNMECSMLRITINQSTTTFYEFDTPTGFYQDGLGAAALGDWRWRSRLGQQNTETNGRRRPPSRRVKCLQGLLLTKTQVDQWLAGRRFPSPNTTASSAGCCGRASRTDGVDKSPAFTRLARWMNGSRSTIANRPCRINTYGNSFTQCHQVSDGETWRRCSPPTCRNPFGILASAAGRFTRRIADAEGGTTRAGGLHHFKYLR